MSWSLRCALLRSTCSRRALLDSVPSGTARLIYRMSSLIWPIALLISTQLPTFLTEMAAAWSGPLLSSALTSATKGTIMTWCGLKLSWLFNLPASTFAPLCLISSAAWKSSASISCWTPIWSRGYSRWTPVLLCQWKLMLTNWSSRLSLEMLSASLSLKITRTTWTAPDQKCQVRPATFIRIFSPSAPLLRIKERRECQVLQVLHLARNCLLEINMTLDWYLELKWQVNRSTMANKVTISSIRLTQPTWMGTTLLPILTATRRHTMVRARRTWSIMRTKSDPGFPCANKARPSRAKHP